MSKLMGFDFEIHYKERAENLVVDALSRWPGAELLPLILNNAKEELLEIIKGCWTIDPQWQLIISELYMTCQLADILVRMNCDVCQRCKHDLAASPSLLQPLLITNQMWNEISIDFIEELSNSHGKLVIFVVMYKLSEYAHFMALSHS
ncbi:hypothetical protein CR513_39942, partial [Mucuna pruriens]